MDGKMSIEKHPNIEHPDIVVSDPNELIVYLKYYGVLFGDGYILKYFSEEDKKVYTLAKAPKTIQAILADGDRKEVYFSYEWGKVCSLFSDFESESRGSHIDAIQKHKDKILDSGWYGLVSCLDNKVLISREEMEKENIVGIVSLVKDEEENLYGLVKYKDFYYGLITLPESSGRYSIGERILSYGVHITPICQAVLVPGQLKGENGKTYPFSVLSCVDSGYLDLNGEKIKGKEPNGTQIIHRVALLPSDKIEVIYSGSGLHKIIKAEINPKTKEAKTEILVDGLASRIWALEVVKDEKLHNKLIERGTLVKAWRLE